MKPLLTRAALASFFVLSSAAGAYPLASCASGGDGGGLDFDGASPPTGNTDSAGPTNDGPGRDDASLPSKPDSAPPLDAGTDNAAQDAEPEDVSTGTDAADAPSQSDDASDGASADAADAADAALPDASDSGVPSLGLVGEWLCTGNTNDTSGNGNNGTGSAVTFVTDRHNIVSSACGFNGASSSIGIPTSASLNVTATWSLSAWIQPSGFGALAGIVSKYQTINAKGPAVRLSNTSPFTSVDVNEASYPTDAASGFLTSGKWSHVGVTVNGLAVSCYIDDVLAYSGTAGYATQSNTNSLAIGVDYANRFFAGSIDDVRLYNRVLSAAEIESLYLAP